MTDSIFGPGVIETYSGTAYKFEDPNPEIVTIEDVAHALSNTCRFGGHVQRYYSVAEHSVLVSRIVAALDGSDELQEAALLHDAAEAYVGDVPKPLKIILGEEYGCLSDCADWAIGRSLMVMPSLFHHDAIKLADNIALKFEGRQLMRSGAHRWNDTPLETIPDLPNGVLAWPLGLDPGAAKELFFKRAEALGFECPVRTEGVPYAPPLPDIAKEEMKASKKYNSSTITPAWLRRGVTVTQ